MTAVSKKIPIKVETLSLYNGFTVYAMLPENAGNDARIVQKLKEQNSMECEHKE